ncbi:hypothetical protein CsSME_00014366 [Camellia sinensis var. sinensis]
MAHSSNLPCDGDAICMICKKKSAEDKTITCKKGFTTLDLLNQNFSDSIDNDISQLLLQAGAKEGYALQSFEIQTHHHPQPPPPPIPKSPKFKEMMVLSLSSMTKSVLLAIFIFLAGATYTCLFSLPGV